MNISLFLFKNRSYTPVPLVLLALVFARPDWGTIIAGFSVMIFGEAIRFWGVSYAGSATRTTAKAGGANLITSGPFGYVRNPLYTGNFFLALGFVIMAWAWMPWMILVFLCLFFFQYTLIVGHEEEYLQQTFKQEYENYRSNVHRWIPRLSPYTGSTKIEPNFSGALRSERNTFQSIVLVTAILIIRWQLFK